MKSTWELIIRQALIHITQELVVSSTTIYRKLKQFTFKEVFSRLPERLSIKEFTYQKGKLAVLRRILRPIKLSPFLIRDAKPPSLTILSDILKKLEIARKSLPSTCLADISHPLQLAMSLNSKTLCRLLLRIKYNNYL